MHIEVPSDGPTVVERATNNNGFGEQMTELEEALRIAHGTAVMLTCDPHLDSVVTGTIEGITAQLKRARDAFEVLAKLRLAERRGAS